MAELADTRDERKADHHVLFLYHGVEDFQCIQKRGTILLGDIVQNGLVVFIKKDDDIAFLIMERLDQLMEHRVGRRFLQGHAVDFRLFP